MTESFKKQKVVCYSVSSVEILCKGFRWVVGRAPSRILLQCVSARVDSPGPCPGDRCLHRRLGLTGHSEQPHQFAEVPAGSGAPHPRCLLYVNFCQVLRILYYLFFFFLKQLMGKKEMAVTNHQSQKIHLSLAR